MEVHNRINVCNCREDAFVTATETSHEVRFDEAEDDAPIGKSLRSGMNRGGGARHWHDAFPYLFPYFLLRQAQLVALLQI